MPCGLGPSCTCNFSQLDSSRSCDKAEEEESDTHKCMQTPMRIAKAEAAIRKAW